MASDDSVLEAEICSSINLVLPECQMSYCEGS